MELSLAEELEGLVEKMVTSGKPNLDNAAIKKLKSLCKHSDACLEHTFHILLTELLKDHCEVRLSAFQIVNELFIRSHLFRTLLLKNFQQFMDCTIETDFDNPLPPPKAAADKLKEDALLAIKSWYDKFGIAYQKLSLAFEYLKNVKKINFDDPRPQIRNAALERRLSRKKIVNGMLLDKLQKQIDENIWEIHSICTEINNCLELLVPTFKEDKPAPNELEDNQLNEESNSVLRETGIPERGYVVEIDLSEVSAMKVDETDDNKAVFDRLRELNAAANRIHLPRLRKWLTKATKCEALPDVIKNLIDVKIKLQTALNKCNEMNIVNESDDDQDFDDFVEVPEVFKTPSTSSHSQVKSKPQSKNKKSKDTNIWKPLKDTDISDPTTYSYALAKQTKLLQQNKSQQVTTDTMQKKLQKIIPSKTSFSKSNNDQSLLKEKAPVVPFGRDLLAWDAEKYKELKSNISVLGAAREFDVGHRFYGGHSASETNSGVSEAVLNSITSRTIEFTGEFRPVVRSCKAPLPNGKLCPRQDRFKCPFHGKIIPRDATGNPIGTISFEQPSTSSQTSDWNDPQFLSELENSLGPGVQLTQKTKKKKKDEVGLTDLKKVTSTSRSRLQRKVLSRKSLKRVAETMNVLDAKRNLDKFGNNFNYALH